MFFTEELESLLPLSLETISYSEGKLILQGKEWGFLTQSNWRIRDKDKLIFGCYDKEVYDTLDELKNCKIVSVQLQTQKFPLDPVFVFSNGYYLEVFSTVNEESWVFRTSTHKIFIGSPENEILVKCCSV